MTYCVAMCLDEGLVFASDSRTNAGIDHIATFRKLFTFGVPGERLIVLQSAGNLATSQSVVNLLKQRLDDASQVNLHSVPTLYEATALVAATVREVVARDAAPLAGNTDLTCSFLVGGQIAGGPPELYSIYPQGNFIQATEDTPFLQLGESKYGKPILDRNLEFTTSLAEGLRCALVSFDSTIRSNLSVGMPLDLLVYHRDSLIVPAGYRVTEEDAYYASIRKQWSAGLHELLAELPAPPVEYNI
ncbi:putative proteasome-type protease [Pseudomonas citronellolis]|uniref:Proteasome-type protease n=1 Tax=Pseudomonas citronellolis TaxID=53408 RepID=A0AAQ1KG19_9PSED|nr:MULTISPECIES: proteasome-type protease [Pseudomonas]KWR73455.1 peptidase [Pseudomonas sp. PI1]MBB1605760.1 peptidase [Pseudomonas sp. UMC76]MBB1636507.1 peptidase [Pseudomonas sp. UME83]NTX93239.1 peptidase [Pseudomonas sp. UMA643]NTY21279.1 peptidase [Pseudomonas sp. UMC3103]